MEEKSGAERQISSAHPDVRLGALAARQHGVVGRRQLLAIGIDDGGIKRRASQGRLHRVHQGVYAVGHPRLTTDGRWMAAVVACGQGAVLSHFDAAALWRIYDGTGPRVHVTVRWHRRADGLWIHRARRLHADDVAVKDGIPVTSVARTLVDLTDLLGRDRLLRAIREAEYLGLLDLDSLTAAVERAHGRQRMKALKEALATHTPGQIVRDELEHRFLELVREGGLPPPRTNVRITAGGRRYEVDCLWPEEQVAVELDGRAAHARTTAFESDRRKDSALNAIGLRPLRFTWYRVTREPNDVVAELEATLAQSGVRLSAA